MNIVELNKRKRLNIVCIGDTAIDDYRYGKCNRISPENPVKILTTQDEEQELRPAMTANTCYQLNHFNVNTYLIGFVDDTARDLYKQFKFDISNCVSLVKGQVPVKTRFYDGDYPIFRWDLEKPNYNEKNIGVSRHAALLSLEYLIRTSHIDVVILSDYDKGFWDEGLAQNVINLCNSRNITTVVDPKKALTRWKNCTIFKPNSKEAKEMTGCSNWQEQVDYIQNQIHCKGIIITQEGNGFVGKYEDKQFEYKTKPSKEVNSVIGGGDLYSAILATCLGHKIDFEESCLIAFNAGTQYVKAKHNTPITPYEILKQTDSSAAKLISIEDLLYLKNTIYSKEKFVFTNGTFQILHDGHIEILKFAKNKGDKLIVGLNSDTSVNKIKSGKLLNSWESRAKMLSAIEYVDFLIKFEEDTPLELIKQLNIDVLVKGSDYKIEEVIGREYAKEVFLAPILPGFSTTNIMRKIKNIEE